MEEIETLTKQEEKYAAELEEALKQFSELKEQAKNVDSADSQNSGSSYRERRFNLPLPRSKRHMEKNLIRLSCLTASVMFLNYWGKKQKHALFKNT